MSSMWKVVGTDEATVGELYPYGDPSTVVAADMSYSGSSSCRELQRNNESHKRAMLVALFQKLGDCKILHVTYKDSSARVLVRKYA